METRHMTNTQRLEYLDLPSLWHRRIRGDMIQVFKIINGIDDISCEERRMHPARGRFARFDLDRQIASTFPAHWKVGPVPVFWASQPLEPAEWLALLILKAGDVESNPGLQNRKLPPLRPDHSDNNTQFNNTLACNHITP